MTRAHQFIRKLVICAAFSVLAWPTAGRADAESDYQKAKSLFESGDVKQAAKWLVSAVEQGHSEARLPLAAMYLDGMGVQQDASKAVALFTIAANEGYPSAQFTLGAIYRAGEVVARDYDAAMTWFQKAARQGDEGSQNNLGTMYEAGRGAASNQVTALMWYEVAAINGSQRGEINFKRLRRKLNKEQKLMAKKQVLICLDSKYRDCSGTL